MKYSTYKLFDSYANCTKSEQFNSKQHKIMFGKKIIRYGASHAVIIPSEIIQACGWTRGEMLVFNVKGKDVVELHHVTDAELSKLLEERNQVIEA